MNKTTKICLGVWACLIALVLGSLVYFELTKVPQEPTQQALPSPVTKEHEEPQPIELPDHLRHLSAITTRVKATQTEGSGLLVKRGETPYLWTAGYVVDGLRREEKTKNPTTGIETTVVTWSPATALVTKKDLRVEITADVIRYDGPAAPALLRLRETLLLSKSAVFAEEEVIPTVGLVVYHVADFSLFPSSYVAKGSIMTVSRVYDEHTYDVTSKMGIPGSGGGGVFTEEGTCIGMVMRGGGDFDLILPSREIRRWAKDKNVLWALDLTVPMPSEEELKKIPIEG